jgi:hypothetical protein
MTTAHRPPGTLVLVGGSTRPDLKIAPPAHTAGEDGSEVNLSSEATLGPIDPSVNSPLNPAIPAAPPDARMPVSIEEVAAYFDLATLHLGLKEERWKTEIFVNLAQEAHRLPACQHLLPLFTLESTHSDIDQPYTDQREEQARLVDRT